MSNINLTEVLDAIEMAMNKQPPDQEGFTSSELMAALGWGRDRTLQAVKMLANKGQVVPDWIHRTSMHGVSQRIKGYRFIKQTEVDKP